MKYDYIESLVIKAKNGDTLAKEEIILEFKPFILALVKKTFIPGYDFCDIENECYSALLKSLSLYTTERHRFVGYAMNSIKNKLNTLIKVNINKNAPKDITFANFNDEVEYIKDSSFNIDDNLLELEEASIINSIISQMPTSDYEIFKAIFIDKISLKNYAIDNNISYSTAFSRKNHMIKFFKNSYYEKTH